MMESPHFPSASRSADDQSALRTPEWAELAARFGAARELRAALHGGHGRSGGSFSRFVAADQPSLNSQTDHVNLNGLGHGKADLGIFAVPEVDGPLLADRETQ